MEENGSKFILIESDYQSCMDKRSCKLSDEIPNNVTVLWMVEMIRHRNPSRGHANELKLTVFPIRRLKGTDNNSKREAKRDPHPYPRSFVIRDKDYPLYFVDTGLPTLFVERSSPTATPIQKRTFDMITSLADNNFDSYHLPLHFNYNGNDQLNTGEFYAGEIQDIGPTVPTYQNYGNSISSTPYQSISEQVLHSGHHIRFPTTEGITGPSSAFLDRISTTPLTATHLHHHFYLNRNQIDSNLFHKGHLYDKHAGHGVHEPYNLGNLQNLHHNSAGDLLDTNHHGFDQQKHNFAVNHQQSVNPPHISALIKFPSGTGAPSQSYHDNQQYNRLPTPTEHPQFHQLDPSGYALPKPYQFPEHLQIASPPVPQTNGYYAESAIPLTTAAGKFYAPFHMYPAAQVHPRLNQQILLHAASPTPPFQGSYQLDNNQYSEPDPIYHHHPLSVLGQHLQPHLLAHLNPSYANRIQHHQPINVDQISNNGQLVHTPGTLDVIPLNDQGHPITSSKPPVLSTGTGGYDIPSEKLHLEPDHNGSKYDQLPVPSGADFSSGGANPNQESYPDSINAQLPPPNQNEDQNVPYVDSTHLASQTSTELVDRPNPTPKIRQKYRNPDGPRKKKPTNTGPLSEAATTQNILQSPLTLEQIKRLRNRGSNYQPKTTTEKAILKWMPKKTKPRAQDDFNSLENNNSLQSTPITITSTTRESTSKSELAATPSSSESTTQKVFIVTPTQEVDDDEATSISTSISYKVGDEEEHRTVTSSGLTNDIAQQVYNGFLPTIQPGGGVGVIDVAQGKLARINTNDSTVTLFRASDERDDDRPMSGTTIEEEQIARSILKHADGLN